MSLFDFLEKLLDGVAVKSVRWRNKCHSIINLRKARVRVNSNIHTFVHLCDC
jgi:hypothetical protein